MIDTGTPSGVYYYASAGVPIDCERNEMPPVDPYTMYVTEDVFSWAIWSEDNPPSQNATPTIKRGESVRVITSSYVEDGVVWHGIHYYNRRYEIPSACLASDPVPQPPHEKLKTRTATFKKKGFWV